MYTLNKPSKPRTKVSKTLLEERARLMRTQVNTHEQNAIDILKQHKVPFKHEVVTGFYIADLVLLNKCLIVEIDGSSHIGRAEKDAKRDAFCKSCGLTTLRIVAGQEDTIIDQINTFPDLVGGPRLTREAIETANKRRESSNKHYAKKKKTKSVRKRK